MGARQHHRQRTDHERGRIRLRKLAEFILGTPEGKPWFFWFGSRDPQRGYEPGSGIRAGMDPAKVRVPTHLPDTPEIRSNLCS